MTNQNIDQALIDIDKAKVGLLDRVAHLTRLVQKEMNRAADMESALYWMVANNPWVKLPEITLEKLKQNRDQLRNGRESWEKLVGPLA